MIRQWWYTKLPLLYVIISSEKVWTLHEPTNQNSIKFPKEIDVHPQWWYTKLPLLYITFSIGKVCTHQPIKIPKESPWLMSQRIRNRYYKTLGTSSVCPNVVVASREGERGPWAVYYTSPQFFLKIKF